MILREISLEPTYPHNYLHTGFSWETYCVVDLFMRNCQFKNEYPIRKLVISLFSEIEYESFPWSKEFQIQLDTIGVVCLVFDFDRYFQLGDFEKREVLLDTLIEGIKSFATSTGVALAPFETAFQKCLDADIQNVSLFKTVKSIDRSRIAKIFIETNLKSTSVFAILSDVDGNFKEKKTFFEVEPELLIDKDLLKRAFWTNHDTLRLIGRQEEEFWEVTFKN